MLIKVNDKTENFCGHLTGHILQHMCTRWSCLTWKDQPHFMDPAGPKVFRSPHKVHLLNNDNKSAFFVFFINYVLYSWIKAIDMIRYLIWCHLRVLNHYTLHLSSHACPLGIEQTRVLGLLHTHHALVARLLAGHHGLETWRQETTSGAVNLEWVNKGRGEKKQKGSWVLVQQDRSRTDFSQQTRTTCR